ncbi:AraC-type DNA-binding protein [Agreia bicolorata]|uniref:HTH-type transcriptional regulator RipA n=1 Tax=Agreia bicolorata TaxID=110935 RepID=A0A1T4YEB6_9MICO|nr:AraC family transcriptional regulator [Agreia bicolorata]SKB00177.1 AraC-type DNA-binding protein [Agreia bicolorata]
MSTAAYLLSDLAVVGASDAADETSSTFFASRSRVDSGTLFAAHQHREDQLAWMASGSMELAVQGERWQLRREHLAWIPAGILHEMAFDEPGELISVYADTALRPAGDSWHRPRTLRAEALAGALMLHLADASPTAPRKTQVRQLLADLLADSPAQHDAVALPRDPRARAVASSLLAHPDDQRSLAAWAVSLGVSSKTLARAFVADTGSSFREWRVRARLHAAARMLAGGDEVQHVARAVGYESVSSFIAAFKVRFGTTPARYRYAVTAGD